MDVRNPETRLEPGARPAVRSVTLLGATGSIGTSTIDLIRRNRDRYRVEAISAHRNAAALATLARELNVRFAAISDPAAYAELKEALAGSGIEAGAGEDALIEAAERPAEWVLAAIVGSAGLKSALAAARRGVTVALANKECLVCAGDLFMRTAEECGAQVLPVDSEHNAIYQALKAGRREDVRTIILTASGGPFRTWSLDDMRKATRAQALKHPNWSMGAKITIDSASMMNKGLELIEAHHLFQVDASGLDVLVHPQSIVHGLVEYIDGSVVAQLGSHDMRIPIAYCLAWPDRIEGPAKRLDLAQLARLDFEQPDPVRFPALAVTKQALEIGGAAPTVMNAANEVAVEAFLNDRVFFTGIVEIVQATLEAAAKRGLLGEPANIDEAIAVDRMARSLAHDRLREIAAKAS